MQLIVGLGNPGKKYAPTRHNVGAWLVEALAQQHNSSWQLATQLHCRLTSFHSATATIWLAIPTTYMNLCGQMVAAIAHFYKIPSHAILIAHDELDLPVGTIRLKHGGGHGGHNGLRSIMQHLHSNAFYRIRIGIGRPQPGTDVAGYVLSQPNTQELSTIQYGIAHVLTHMDLILNNNIDNAMQILHTYKGNGC